MERECRFKIPSNKLGVVSKSKKEGGLGIGGILDRYVALLGKWFWRFSLK